MHRLPTKQTKTGDQSVGSGRRPSVEQVGSPMGVTVHTGQCHPEFDRRERKEWKRPAPRS